MTSIKSILVTDDDPGILEMLVDFLGGHGYEVLCADSGDAALRQIKEHPVDMVISDVNMPQMDGLKLCRRVREKDPNIPIIIMSGSAPTEQYRDLYETIGASDCITKPFPLPDLLQKVQALL